jgi:hypothetical protein
MTARPGSAARVAATAASPPRTLNEPVGCTVSILRETRSPSWGAATTGVTGR